MKGLIASGTSFNLPAGSVWIASQQLTATAPAGGYTRLKIKSGALTFSQSLASTATEIVVPAAVTFTGTGATITAVGKGHLEAYGTGAEIDPQATPSPVYAAVVGRILVPAKTDITQFKLADVHSDESMSSGTAPVTSAAWALPMAIMPPTSLGTASGGGAVCAQAALESSGVPGCFVWQCDLVQYRDREPVGFADSAAGYAIESCLAVETPPGGSPFADPLGGDLGHERLLRTSPLCSSAGDLRQLSGAGERGNGQRFRRFLPIWRIPDWNPRHTGKIRSPPLCTAPVRSLGSFQSLRGR